jgi:hypothetical protein
MMLASTGAVRPALSLDTHGANLSWLTVTRLLTRPRVRDPTVAPVARGIELSSRLRISLQR